MKKGLVLSLAIILVLSIFLAACSSGNNTSNGPADNGGTDKGSTNETAEPGSAAVKFTAFAPQQARIENMSTNWFTKHVEELVNIKIEWNLAPAAGANDAKQLLLASGDYPEVFIHGDLTKAEQLRYGKQGVLIPLNDLIEKYGPNIKKAMDNIDGYQTAITAPDGNIYSLPQVNECFHCFYSQKMWINKAWLDALKIPIPTTTEEFHKALMAFKNDDPNGNGKPDEIPLAGAINTWHGNVEGFLMNAFIYDNSEDFFMMNSGKVDLVANKPEWRKGLKYVSQLYADGLIQPTSFTQEVDALKQIGDNPDAEILGAFTAGHPAMAVTLSDENRRHADYVVLPPLKGPDGNQTAAYYPSIGNGQFAITNKASKEQQVAAIKMADYLATEEAAIMSVFGPEGKYWRYSKPDEVGIDGKPAKYTQTVDFSTITTWNDSWDQLGPSIRTMQHRNSFAMPQDEMLADGYELRLFNATVKYEPFRPKELYPLSVFMEPNDAEEANRLRTTINNYIKESIVAFIVGNKKIDNDSDWNDYVKGLDDLNLTRYLEIYQTAFDNVK